MSSMEKIPTEEEGMIDWLVSKFDSFDRDRIPEGCRFYGMVVLLSLYSMVVACSGSETMAKDLSSLLTKEATWSSTTSNRRRKEQQAREFFGCGEATSRGS